MITAEIWRPVVGYANRYEISDLGRLRNIKFGKPRVLSPRLTVTGYRQVGLSDAAGRRKMLSVHRLVALAFIPNPEQLPQINHRDEVKTNNCFENLEWCMGQYNRTYNNTHKRYGAHVSQHDLAGRVVADFDTIADASQQTGVDPSDISRCINALQKTAGGFIWAREGGEKRRTRAVETLPLDGSAPIVYASAAAAGRAVGVYPGGILACCHTVAHCKSSGGFAWRFAEEPTTKEAQDAKENH